MAVELAASLSYFCTSVCISQRRGCGSCGLSGGMDARRTYLLLFECVRFATFSKKEDGNSDKWRALGVTAGFQRAITKRGPDSSPLLNSCASSLDTCPCLHEVTVNDVEDKRRQLTFQEARALPSLPRINSLSSLTALRGI